ncbi:MAG: hypothetical protein R2712_21370 [Vicinamibacterales bacterium]
MKGTARAAPPAILAAVTYAAIFDYPLTAAQVAESLIGVRADRDAVLRCWRRSPILQAAIERHGEFLIPVGRADLLATRARREATSRLLLARHRGLLRLVAALPFVRMVALSGSLAHLNADDDGDVDLFVITAPGRVWLVAVMAILLARLCGWRRRLCLNYLVSERALTVPSGDLFSANQILHLRPVAGHETYLRFLAANPGVRSMYPNFHPRPLLDGLAVGPAATRVRRAVEWLAAGPSLMLERLCRLAYRRYLEQRAGAWASRDQVQLAPEILKLHTASHRARVMARFDTALARAHAPAARQRIG